MFERWNLKEMAERREAGALNGVLSQNSVAVERHLAAAYARMDAQQAEIQEARRLLEKGIEAVEIQKAEIKRLKGELEAQLIEKKRREDACDGYQAKMESDLAAHALALKSLTEENAQLKAELDKSKGVG